MTRLRPSLPKYYSTALQCRSRAGSTQSPIESRLSAASDSVPAFCLMKENLCNSPKTPYAEAHVHALAQTNHTVGKTCA